MPILYTEFPPEDSDKIKAILEDIPRTNGLINFSHLTELIEPCKLPTMARLARKHLKQRPSDNIVLVVKRMASLLKLSELLADYNPISVPSPKQWLTPTSGQIILMTFGNLKTLYTHPEISEFYLSLGYNPGDFSSRFVPLIVCDEKNRDEANYTARRNRHQPVSEKTPLL